MPVVRYFFFVGSVLLALLFVADAYLPKIPAEARVDNTDLSVIRIQSDRKWPERVVFDTSRAAVASSQTTQAGVPATATAADISARARVRDAYAQLQPADQAQQRQPADQTQAQLPDPKKPDVKPVPKRKIARRHPAPPVMLVAQQPQFGFFGNNTW